MSLGPRDSVYVLSIRLTSLSVSIIIVVSFSFIVITRIFVYALASYSAVDNFLTYSSFRHSRFFFFLKRVTLVCISDFFIHIRAFGGDMNWQFAKITYTF